MPKIALGAHQPSSSASLEILTSQEADAEGLGRARVAYPSENNENKDEDKKKGFVRCLPRRCLYGLVFGAW